LPAFNELIQRSKWKDILIKWRQELEIAPDNRVISQNFNREVKLNPSIHRVLEEFLKRLGEFLNTNIFKTRVETLIVSLVDSSPFLHLQGKIVSDRDNLSRIMALEDVNNYLAHYMGWSVNDLTSIRQAILAKTFVPRGELKTSRPFCWVTTTEYIDNFRKKCSDPQELADSLIRGLGLLHLDQIELCEILYPKDNNPTVKHPTVLDAGSHKIFRPCADTGNFGRAINLRTLHNDGPEAVHAGVKAGDGFKARLIGISSLRITIDWMALYNSNDPGLNC